MKWIARIGQDRNFRGGRNHFPQYFYLFADEPGYGGRKTRYVAARMRHALDEAEPLGIGRHEYNRNAGSCRFQGYCCWWIGGDEQIGAESYQFGGESWQAILGGGITILDDQVSSIDPAVVSQPVKPRFLNGRLHHIHGEKANPTTCPLRPRTPWRNEQRRRSRNKLSPLHSILSQLEDDGTQSITSRLWPHSLRAQMLRRKCRALRKTAMGQNQKSGCSTARPA